MTEKLQNLPLSALFSGPLIAAIDASVEAQTETVELLREYGYDEDGTLVTVTFGYTTTESDPSGGTRRVAREIEIPLVLFLSLPNLVIHEIEEEFSAKITEVETTGDDVETASSHSIVPYRPPRLRVTPSKRETAVDRKTRSTYDLNVRMVAELRNQSAGMDALERVTATATTDRVDEERTERLAERRGQETDGGIRSKTRVTADAGPDGTSRDSGPTGPAGDARSSTDGPAVADSAAESLPVEPADTTVADLRAALTDVDDVAVLESLEAAERAGPDRKTARRAIDRRIETVRKREESAE